MVAVNYNVQYINQYGAVVRDVEKIGTVGDTVSVTPNQLAFGFQTIVADPKSLTLEEDATKNVVKFDVIQDMNDFTIASRNLSKKVADGDAGLDRRLKVAEKIIVDNFLSTKTIWTGKVKSGSITVPSIPLSSINNLIFEPCIGGYILDEKYAFSTTYPLTKAGSSITLSKSFSFSTSISGKSILGTRKRLTSTTGVTTSEYYSFDKPVDISTDGSIKITVNNSKNITVSCTAIYAKTTEKKTTNVGTTYEYVSVPIYLKAIKYN